MNKLFTQQPLPNIQEFVSHVGEFNPIATSDSYKYSHPFLIHVDIEGQRAYIEARKGSEDMLLFGLQAWIKKYLLTPIEQWMISEVSYYSQMHGLPFDIDTWQAIADSETKRIPITIYAVPEGLPMPTRNAVVVVEGLRINGIDFQTLVTWIETSLHRAVWYGSTRASDSFNIKRMMARIYESAGADMSMLQFAYHDFGARGVTCGEQAENGGMAHLISYKGTDTFECLRAINRWYNPKNQAEVIIAGYSVWASEHNIALGYGIDEAGELSYIDAMLTTVETTPSCKILSFVIDTTGDWKRCAKRTLDNFGERLEAIAKSGKRIVFRPDSDDMQVTVPTCLSLIDERFGSNLNSKGLKIPRYVGVIQGDGVDRLSAEALLTKLICVGFCPSSVVFGSGGRLLQGVSRDDMSFAMKNCQVKFVGEDWTNVQKQTTGKKSKPGNLRVIKRGGEYVTVDVDVDYDANTDIMISRKVYENGELLVDESFVEICERAV